MDLNVSVVLLAACVVAQNYRVIEVTTIDNSFEEQINNNHEVHFALKGCPSSVTVILFDQAGNSLYRSVFRPSKREITLHNVATNQKMLVFFTPAMDICSKFDTFKLRWTDGKLRLWHKFATAKWSLVGEMTLTSVIIVHKYKFQSAAEVNWQVFVEEHATTPFHESCVVF